MQEPQNGECDTEFQAISLNISKRTLHEAIEGFNRHYEPNRVTTLLGVGDGFLAC